MIEGLYVTVSPDGTIKKYLSTKSGEVSFPDRSVAEELISFSEQDYVFLAMYRKELCCYACGNGTYPKVVKAVKRVSERIKKQNLLCGTLVRLEFLDCYHYWTPDKRSRVKRLVETTLYFGTAFDAWREANVILKQLSENSQADMQDYTATYFSVTQQGKPTTYIFRSEAQYIYFLLQHLLTAKVPICKCQFCGGYFVPKTKHKTLYCDRIIRDGKTCKQVAPMLKRRELAAANIVVSEFNRVKDMLRHRYERALDSKKDSSIDIDYDTYNQWLSAATTVRDKHLAGMLTQEEALDIIYVPTKLQTRAACGKNDVLRRVPHVFTASPIQTEPPVEENTMPKDVAVNV